MSTLVLTVLGGTGFVGREVVRQAVAGGHAVNVLSRSRERARALRQPLTVVGGDALDPADVDRAVASADSVISVLGHGADGRRDLLTRAMTHILDAMDRHDVSRLVVVTTTAVTCPGDRPTRRQRLRSVLSRTPLVPVDRDHVRQVSLLAESDMDWTVVRAPRVVDRLLGARYRVVGALDSTIGSEIGRGDLAAFLLDCAVSQRRVREMPVISDPPRERRGDPAG